MTRRLIIFLLISTAWHVTSGQINILDSCGVDSKLELNKYEIRIVDSLFLARHKTKKGVTIDPKEGFELTNKKLAFFSCSKDSQARRNGLLSKSEFFEIARQNFEGYAGKGIIAFDENQKTRSNGFDAVLVVNCLMVSPKLTNEIISQLAAKHD